MVDAGSPTGDVGAARRERIKQRALREILDAAREELRLHGPTGVTMRAVAAAVDLTPSGLYRHVSGLDELLGLLAADAYEAIGAAMLDARDRASAGDHATEWYLIGMAMRQWYITHQPEYELLMTPRLITSPPDRLRIASGRTLDMLARVCEDAIEAGQIDLERASFTVDSTQAHGGLSAASRSLSTSALAAMTGHVLFETAGLFEPAGMDAQKHYGRSLRGVMTLMGFTNAPGPLVLATL